MSLHSEIDDIIMDLSCDYHDSDSANKLINKVLDAAIEAAETERLNDDTGDPSDIAYEAAINDVVHVIGNLKGGN